MVQCVHCGDGVIFEEFTAADGYLMRSPAFVLQLRDTGRRVPGAFPGWRGGRPERCPGSPGCPPTRVRRDDGVPSVRDVFTDPLRSHPDRRSGATPQRHADPGTAVPPVIHAPDSNAWRGCGLLAHPSPAWAGAAEGFSPANGRPGRGKRVKCRASVRFDPIATAGGTHGRST